MSESEGEEAEDSKVKLPQNVPGRGNVKSAQSAMKLTEVGIFDIIICFIILIMI